MLYDFRREGTKIVATNYPTLLGKMLGYKPKEYQFTPKGTYKPFLGVNVYYDQYGREWDNRRITVFDDTGITYPR